MTETITVQDLAARINAGGIDLIDVREVHEYVAGHVPGARSIPMSILPVRVNEIPKGSEVHVICQSGARSMQVAIWLANQGYSRGQRRRRHRHLGHGRRSRGAGHGRLSQPTARLSDPPPLGAPAADSAVVRQNPAHADLIDPGPGMTDTAEDRIGCSDCERIRDGWLAQPVNALTSLAFVGAAGVVLARTWRPARDRRGEVLAYSTMLALVGAGSVAFHGPQPPGARAMHDLPIPVLLGLAVGTPLVRRRRGQAPLPGWSRRRGAALAATGAAARAGLRRRPHRRPDLRPGQPPAAARRVARAVRRRVRHRGRHPVPGR